MFNAFRALRPCSLANASRAFSTSQPRAVAQLTLIGNIAQDAEVRVSRKDQEYVLYTVVTNNTVHQDGEYRSVPTYHRVVCFDATDIERVRNLKKGTNVFVQAEYSIKEPEPDADSRTQQQRQINLNHSYFKVLRNPKPQPSESESNLQVSENF